LSAGHAYRATARLSTLQAKEGEWSWSFHATANRPGHNSLTPEQMSGMSELPDRTKGPRAGQIAKYDYATSTKGEWVVRSSGVDGPGKSVGDIALPEGCDSITLWFRLEGTNVTGTAVGLDSVALEDLGKRQDNSLGYNSPARAVTTGRHSSPWKSRKSSALGLAGGFPARQPARIKARPIRKVTSAPERPRGALFSAFRPRPSV
jgi:hypothetical protein